MLKFIKAALLIAPLFLAAETFTIAQMDEIVPYVQRNSLVLLDIDDTLIESALFLRRSAWDTYARPIVKKLIQQNPEIPTNLWDLLSLYIARNVPVKLVERSTAVLISELQDRGIAVLGLTARGKGVWNYTHSKDIQELTLSQLQEVGITFKNSVLPHFLKTIAPADVHAPFEGVLFTSNVPKGKFLKTLFSENDFFPTHVIFVDDRLTQIQSVENALVCMGIQSHTFHYRCIEKRGDFFNPLAAAIQLNALLAHQKVLSDEEAIQLAMNNTQNEQVLIEQTLLKWGGRVESLDLFSHGMLKRELRAVEMNRLPIP